MRIHPWALCVLGAMTIVGGVARPQAEACQPRQYVDEVITPAGATIAPGGGLVIAMRGGIPSDVAPDAEPPDRAEIVTDGSAAPVPLQSVDIAPGLTVRGPKPPKRGAPPRTILFTPRGGGPGRTVTERPAHAPAAPRVRRVASDLVRVAMDPQASRFGGPSGGLTIDLDGPPPADAFAIIVYVVDRSGPEPIIWLPPDPANHYSITTGGKSCGGGPGPVYQRDRVEVAWLDVHGLLSPRSAVAAVRATPPPSP